jgi:hypothetical protein
VTPADVLARLADAVSLRHFDETPAERLSRAADALARMKDPTDREIERNAGLIAADFRQMADDLESK